MIREKLIFKVFEEDVIDTCPIDALDFITAHETATGSTVGQVQKDAYCTLVSMMQGNGTTNSNNLYSLFDSAGAEIHPMLPIDDSTANATAYGIEMFSKSSSGTFINMVSGDFTPQGITGGTGKIFVSDKSPIDYPQDDVAFGFYINERFDTSVSIRMGCDAGSSTDQVQIQSRPIATDTLIRINTTNGSAHTLGSAIDRTGLVIGQRTNSTTQEQWVNNVLVDSETVNSTGRSSKKIGFQGFYRNETTVLLPSVDRFSMYLIIPFSLTPAQHQDLFECIDTYQTNVITGGRNA